MAPLTEIACVWRSWRKKLGGWQRHRWPVAYRLKQWVFDFVDELYYCWFFVNMWRYYFVLIQSIWMLWLGSPLMIRCTWKAVIYNSVMTNQYDMFDVFVEVFVVSVFFCTVSWYVLYCMQHAHAVRMSTHLESVLYGHCLNMWLRHNFISAAQSNTIGGPVRLQRAFTAAFHWLQLMATADRSTCELRLICHVDISMNF